MGGKKRTKDDARPQFDLGDDRERVTYRFRGEVGKEIAHEVTAVELTDDDVSDGTNGKASPGDFIVTREGYAPQWWTRDSFLDQYEAV